MSGEICFTADMKTNESSSPGNQLWGIYFTDREYAREMGDPLRTVIDVVPAHESTAAVKARAERRAWLSERGYRVLDVDASAIEVDLPQVLDRLAEKIAMRGG